MFIDDCLEGLLRLMASEYREPLNLGTDEMVTVNQLVDLICEVAGKRLVKRHDLSKPQGVRGRNSDNSRLRKVLGWEPRTSLREGLQSPIRGLSRNCRESGRLAGRLELAAVAVPPPAANVLGVGISAINMEQAVQLSDDLLQSGRKGYVCVTGVHGIMEARTGRAARAEF